MGDATSNPFVEAARHGLSPIPVDTTTKRPLVAWKTFQDSPAELLQLQEWDHANIGIVCGQVSGRLLCIDIEAGFMDGHGLPELRRRLVGPTYQLFWTWLSGYSESTPSGGMHVLVRLEGEGPLEGNTKLASDSDGHTLIETRAEGGYVIVAPSRNGVKGWELMAGGFDQIAYATLDEWEAVATVLRGFDAAPSPQPVSAPMPVGVPSILRLGDSWIDDELARLPQIRTVLSSLGWEPTNRHDEYGEHWTRPGKDLREGSSASISAADRLFVHSTNANLPTGNPTLDALDIILATGLGRRPSLDERTAYLKAQRPPAVRGAGAASDGEVATPSLNLPEGFWDSRKYLSHIRQAALARRLSPDAVWEAVKCFYAATIPWNHRLPNDGTMDYISMIVGNSGAGKSQAKQEAYNLLQILWGLPGVVFPVPPGSGEGMAEFFLDRSGDESNKYRFRGVGYYADEGRWLLDVNSRAGNTTVQALKQLWSGELTGSVAATSERHRWLAPRDVRATCLVSVTPDVAAAFMRRDLTDEGLPQRISWGWAHYPHNAAKPEHPGPLSVHPWQTIPGSVAEIELEPQLEAMIDERALASSRGDSHGLEGHATYAMLKTAAIHAHMDGRLRVTMADWALSETDWRTTQQVRSYLLANAEAGAYDKNQAAGTARAHQTLAENDVYLERAVHNLVNKLRNSGEMTTREVKDYLRSYNKRYRVDHREVIDLAIQRGLAVDNLGIIGGS